MTIAEMKNRNYGFIVDEEQLDAVIAENRLENVLVRCGACRFVTPAQNVKHMMKMVEAGGDYVRDLSFPVKGYVTDMV